MSDLPSPRRSRLALDSVVPNPKNDNTHPQAQLDMLEASVKKFGQPRPILVRAANRMLIAGEGLWRAMKQGGFDKIDALMWDVDQRTADSFLLADNRFGELSRRDPRRRASLIEELQLQDTEMAAIGFLPDEVEVLIAADREEMLAIREVETGPVADRFWVSIRGPLPQQAAVLQRLQESMRDLEGVEVTLGTVEAQAETY